MNERGHSPEQKEIDPAVAFLETAHKLESAITRDPLNAAELQTIEHNLYATWLKYSDKIQRTSDAVVLHDEASYLGDLGKKIEDVIDSSDGTHNVELGRIISYLNGPRLDFEQRLAQIESAGNATAEPDSEEAA